VYRSPQLNRLVLLASKVLLSGLIARIAQFLSAALIARQIEPAGYGIYVFCMGAALLLAQVTSIGWHPLSTVKIPELIAQRSNRELNGFLFASNFVTAVSSIVFIVIALLISTFELLSESLKFPFILASILAVPMGVLLMKKHQLIGIKKSSLGIFLAETLIPSIVLVYAIFIGYEDLNHAMAVLFSATILSAAIATYIAKVAFRQWSSKEKLITDYKGWILGGLPLFMGAASKLIMARMDILMLAPLSTFEETGLYGAAFRLTYLMTFPQSVLLSVVTPLLSECFSKKNTAEGIKYFYMSIAFSAITAIPFAAVVIHFDVDILRVVYGESYITADKALVLLSYSQLVSALSMPLSSFLMTAGRSGSYGAIGLIGLAFNMALNFYLIPSMGGVGAALSSLASNLVILLLHFFSVFSLIKSLKRNTY